MAVLKHKEDAQGTSRSDQSRARPALAGRDAKAAPSPALELQSQLAEHLVREGRWPPAATLGLILATCGGFWSLVAWGVGRLAQ